MTATVLAIFIIVYLGMILGGLPLLLMSRRRHARTGVPVTIATLAITAGWFALRA